MHLLSGREVLVMLDVRRTRISTMRLTGSVSRPADLKALEQEYLGYFENIAVAVFIGDPIAGQILKFCFRVFILTIPSVWSRVC